MTHDFHPFDPSPATHLVNDLAHLADAWEDLGIDPDDFLRCGDCHKWIEDLVAGTHPPVEPADLCRCDEQEEEA